MDSLMLKMVTVEILKSKTTLVVGTFNMQNSETETISIQRRNITSNNLITFSHAILR